MRIYFSGIGGVGLGPLAEIALDAGCEVVGSDAQQSLMTAELEKRGVALSYEQDGKFLRSQPHIDWFVYTSALPSDHPELLAAQKLGIRTAKRDELLAYIIREKNLKLIAVAGTHGKTSTTSMLVWTLQQLGLPVSYSIGTTFSWGPSGKFNPASEYFVYECDEFDRNFLHFSPYLSLITSIEWDHPDTYPTPESYFAAFSEFAAKSQQVISWQSETKNITVPPSAWVLTENEVQRFTLAGLHNRKNATLVAKAVEYLDVSQTAKSLSSSEDSALPAAVPQNKSEVATILSHFPGTSRRFEKLADNLYTDYGHTPTEIAATLQMARELSEHVVLVYQPHQNIRQHEIREHYTPQIFADAQQVYWLPTYLSRENPELEILSPQKLTQQLDPTKIHIANLDDNLWQEIQKARRANTLVLIMGAGNIDSWLRKLHPSKQT